MELPPAKSVIHFGAFHLDLRSGELRKGGSKVRLQEKPLRVLAELARKQGELVTRAELCQCLWPDATFVDFEIGLNTAVKKLRAALCDDAEKPRYIETIPRRGYRFLLPVQFEDVSQKAADVSPSYDSTAGSAPTEDPELAMIPKGEFGYKTLRKYGLVGAIALLTVAAAVVWSAYRNHTLTFHAHDTVLVTDFENETGDPRFDDALNIAFNVSLAQSRYATVLPRYRIKSALKRMGRSENERITRTVGREICLRERVHGLIATVVTKNGQEYEITTQLIDPETDASVRSYAERAYGEGQILDVLASIADRVRSDLGESLGEIRRADRPLPQVTTSSLTALKQYAEANSLWEHTKYDEAVALYKSAIEIDPDFAMAHQALATAYCSYIYNEIQLCRNEYDKAQALSAHLTEREGMVVDVEMADQLGRVEDADSLYDAFLARYPDDVRMRIRYAHLLRLHGHVQQAIEQHKRILAIASDDANVWIEMATAERSLGEFPAALDAYAQAFRLEPSWLTAGNVNREYGLTLIGNGEESKAVAVFSDLLQNPAVRENGLRSLALLNLYHGRYSAAQRQLSDALRIDEDKHDDFASSRVHFLLAVVAQGRGDRETRMQELDAAAASLPSIGLKVVWGSILGQEYARAGALPRAKKLVSFIIPLAKSQKTEDLGFLHLLEGEIAAQQGRTNTAMGLFDQLQDQLYGPTVNPLSLEALASACQKAGNLNQAIALYEKMGTSPIVAGLALREEQQRWATARYTLAMDYASLGDFDKATQTLSSLLDMWKEADSDLPLRTAALELQSRLSRKLLGQQKSKNSELRLDGKTAKYVNK
jgi:DNA-binding winged helix-turn-helix (wHTH) protein/tetratricopeptide (TPR) repeat protein